jgi:hypothetical protein
MDYKSDIQEILFDTEATERSQEKVIIVGNSPSILLREYGELIDSYDVVIRINRCVTKGFEKYLGKKLNIWATSRTDKYEGGKYVPENYKNIKYLWIRTKKSNPNSKDDKTGIKGRYLPLPKDFPKEVRDNPYVMYKDQKWFINYKNLLHPFKLDKEPCTGLLTILTACRFYDDITIHGFTFGLNPTKKGDYSLSGYYRDKELKADASGSLVHPEDSWWGNERNSEWGRKSEALKKREVLKELLENGIPKKSKKDKHGFQKAHPPIKILNKEELEDMNL